MALCPSPMACILLAVDFLNNIWSHSMQGFCRHEHACAHDQQRATNGLGQRTSGARANDMSACDEHTSVQRQRKHLAQHRWQHTRKTQSMSISFVLMHPGCMQQLLLFPWERILFEGRNRTSKYPFKHNNNRACTSAGIIFTYVSGTGENVQSHARYGLLTKRLRVVIWGTSTWYDVLPTVSCDAITSMCFRSKSWKTSAVSTTDCVVEMCFQISCSVHRTRKGSPSCKHSNTAISLQTSLRYLWVHHVTRGFRPQTLKDHSLPSAQDWITSCVEFVQKCFGSSRLICLVMSRSYCGSSWDSHDSGRSTRHPVRSRTRRAQQYPRGVGLIGRVSLITRL